MDEELNNAASREKIIVENPAPVVEVVKPVKEKRDGFPKAIAVVLFVIILLLVGFIVWHFLAVSHEEKECAGSGDDVVVVDEANETEQKYASLALNPENALNGSEYDGSGYAVTLSDSLFDHAIAVYVSNVPKAFACGDEEATVQSVAYLAVDWDTVKTMYGIETDKSGREDNLVVGNIDASRITDVVISGFGQAVGYEAVLFLMDDGTVEYIPLAKVFSDGIIRSYGKLGGVEGVVKFYKNAAVQSCYGVHDVYAQRADGKYYSIGSLIDDLT